jgi:hypothetical protein
MRRGFAINLPFALGIRQALFIASESPSATTHQALGRGRCVVICAPFDFRAGLLAAGVLPALVLKDGRNFGIIVRLAVRIC